VNSYIQELEIRLPPHPPRHLQKHQETQKLIRGGQEKETVHRTKDTQGSALLSTCQEAKDQGFLMSQGH
jgi:hypothetical protein